MIKQLLLWFYALGRTLRSEKIGLIDNRPSAVVEWALEIEASANPERANFCKLYLDVLLGVTLDDDTKWQLELILHGIMLKSGLKKYVWINLWLLESF